MPTTLKPDGRSRPPHLRTWRDGWRHLRFLLVHSPRWLFLLPGLLLVATGAVGMLAIGLRPVDIGGVHLDVHTLAYAGAAMLLGVQMVLFSVLTTMIGSATAGSRAARGAGCDGAPPGRCLVSAAVLFAVECDVLSRVPSGRACLLAAIDPRETALGDAVLR